MAREKLQTKLYKYLILFSGFILLSLWLLQSVFLKDMYKFVRNHELNSAITYFSDNFENEDIDNLIKEIEHNSGVVIMPTKDYKRPEIERSGRSQIPPEAIEKTAVFTQGDDDLSFTFYALITPLDSTISTLRVELFIISILVIILSLAMAIVISKKVARPIEILNESAKDLAKGNFDVNFKADDYLEIEELSDTLNYASDELGKLDSYRKELLANISHDLKTPLSIINSYTQMMKDFKDEVTDENFDMILEETDRLSNLVGDALDISNYENKNVVLNEKIYNLSKQVRNVVDRLNEMLVKDGFFIDTKIEDDIFIKADEIKIEQVIYNLITNAITHSNQSSQIIVRLKSEGSNARFEVTDFGQGIAEKDLANIWDRYYKVDKTHKRNKLGSGLGLSIVREIIKLHGGNYGVSSVPYKQTTFYFSLALAYPFD